MFYVGLCLGFLAMMFYTPMLMARGVNMYYTGEKLTVGESVLCLIPIVNIARAEIQWFGKLFLNVYAFIAVVVFTLIRIGTYVFMRENVTVCQISIILFIAAWVFLVIANVYFVYSVLGTCETMGTGKRVLYSVIYPFGQFFIGKYLATVLKNIAKMEKVYASEYDDDDEDGEY